jgi:hypothetical protein
MLNKKFIVILLLKLHLTIFCLKPTEFCILRQQECKGFYDRSQNYQIKCNKVKCHGTFKHACESNICSNNVTVCEDYSKMNMKQNILLSKQVLNLVFALRHMQERENIKSFKNQFKDCKNKVYEFKSNDFCVNGNNCKIILGYRYQVTRPSNCRCPRKKSFECDKYCTTNSIACDYYKSMRNKKQFANIKDIKECGNQNSTYYRPYYYLNTF